MNSSNLKRTLDELRALRKETEWVEFKQARTSFDFDRPGKYFSALSNEANLKDKECGWLVFGVTDEDRKIVGTQYRPNKAKLDRLKLEVANETTNRMTFIEIHELLLSEGRVVMFQIPAATRGIRTCLCPLALQLLWKKKPSIFDIERLIKNIIRTWSSSSLARTAQQVGEKLTTCF